MTPRLYTRLRDGKASRRLFVAGLLAVFVASAAPAPAAAASLDQFRPAAAEVTGTFDHSVWDRLLKTYLAPSPDGLNRVNYARWKDAGHTELKGYVQSLEAADVAKLGRAEQFAFWSNLYNAKTIDIVLSKYPVASIKDISLGGGLKALVAGGPWQAKVTKVAGVALSLDDIEHEILRAQFKDNRVHYAVNCASIGCPNLATEALTGAKLDAQLNAGAKAFINSERGIKVSGGKVQASSIYTWFEADFGGSAAAVLDHVRKFATPELAAKLESIKTIASYDYNWMINEVKP